MASSTPYVATGLPANVAHFPPGMHRRRSRPHPSSSATSRYRNAWPTFVVAGYVAASRLHDNRHVLSDVLFGSALGMASGWTVVGPHGRSEFALLPIGGKGSTGVALTWTPSDSRRGE